MAKKNSRSKPKPAPRKPVILEAPVEPVVEEIPPEEPSPAEARPRRVAKRTRSQSVSQGLEEQYAYIVDDLRRVFILAGVTFALLVVANIVLDMLAR